MKTNYNRINYKCRLKKKPDMAEDGLLKRRMTHIWSYT